MDRSPTGGAPTDDAPAGGAPTDDAPGGADGSLPVTDRTRLRRHRERGSHDRRQIEAILDDAHIAHVGFAADHGPVVLPMAFVRIDDQIYLHGAPANAMLRALCDGNPVCITVTHLDGLVLARSAFHHSMNYRSVTLFGPADEVTDPDECRRASAALVERLQPGRSGAVRAPDDDEIRRTRFVRVAVVEAAAKVRTGGPVDEAHDLDRPVWAGVIPLAVTAGDAIPDVASPAPAST